MTIDECEITFKNCRKMLSNDGVLIIKNQFGNDMLLLLDNLAYHVDVIDIYPPEMNRWVNTHEYALICRTK